MSAPNVPDVQLLTDSDARVVIKVSAFYTSAQTAGNTVIIQANTLKGANTSIVPCYLDVESIEFDVGTANGFLSVEYVGSAANQKIISFGRVGGAGVFEQWIPNNATNPTGDINLFNSALDANDTYSMVITMRKRNDGTQAWANLFNAYNHTKGLGG
jgi:hypothetical protein